MSRYIDADAFIDDLYEHEFSNWCDKDEVSTLVNDAPSIDIVRCKECKHREKCEQMVVFENGKYITSGYKLDYCSYGEREVE